MFPDGGGSRKTTTTLLPLSNPNIQTCKKATTSRWQTNEYPQSNLENKRTRIVIYDDHQPARPFCHHQRWRPLDVAFGLKTINQVEPSQWHSIRLRCLRKIYQFHVVFFAYILWLAISCCCRATKGRLALGMISHAHTPVASRRDPLKLSFCRAKFRT